MTTRKFFSISLLVLLTFTSLGMVTSTAFSQNVESLKVGEVKNFIISSKNPEIKDFSFIDGDGKTHQLSDYRGKTLLLNFWATWCAPCRKEMPAIDRLQGEMGSDDFTVLAIGQDLQGIEKVKKFLKALNIKHLGAYNDKTVTSGRSTGVFGLPATLILDKNGREFGRLIGPAEWDSEEAKNLIRYVMENPSSQ
ncbi:TlpA disulfide reductase family protein [Sneathiella aquimaris]|uniref:TlpA disulfide reductase family protein n=1 Tax=Sneathiella aquimaris TaxID=2599305 RepID=UPI00146DC837|nr:TlpA disulfide reductase family protein [Sneathiella aquimaris]